MKHVGPGSRLDCYSLDELVAKGATTSVYRAIDLNTGRQVAIKIPDPDVEGDVRFYNRFCREREIGRRLDHPSVAKVLAPPRPNAIYIVMEWVEGQLLRRVLDEPRLPADRAVGIALAVCDALIYIHSQGVVHRDLKPENIMIDSRDRITLIDFGIAGLAGASRLTFGPLSAVMGTADYISPEQVRGKRGDARSDVYALGAILYEMLTGTPPFPGDNTLVVMNSRLVNKPVPPRELAPEISPKLEQIVCRALEREPDRRYGSARGLAWALCHPDQAEAAAPVEVAERARPPAPRTRRAVIYGLLAMIPVFAFGLLFYVARHG